MTDLALTDDLFFTKTGMDRARVEKIVAEALHGMDDGELFLEYSQSESLTLDDGRIKSASFDTAQGFGLRGISDEAAGYAHASELSEDAIRRAGQAVRAVRQGHSGVLAAPPPGTNRQLYTDANPLHQVDFAAKTKLLAEIDAYARSKDSRVRQVSASLSGVWQAVQIIRPDGRHGDIRPLVRLNVSIVVGDGDEMPVLLGPGWPGVMLHEAVGHGLEGDFNRKKTSAFAGLIGQRVASPGVTVVDDGTLKDRRGSLTLHDEGTPSSRTVLIEDGILRGYMQDRLNAHLMGMRPTGNGRRQSYAHAPMPRMTNTVMLGGTATPDEMIRSVKRGLYAVNFGGGQVDITSGKFVFSASEAYLIEDGKIGPAVKGATLIGNGPEDLKKISMIGDDLKLDDGIGTCGKDGQGVPVGVGQPTLRMDGITVGGTAA